VAAGPCLRTATHWPEVIVDLTKGAPRSLSRCVQHSLAEPCWDCPEGERHASEGEDNDGQHEHTDAHLPAVLVARSGIAAHRPAR
jgi:hypothetical protein